MREDKASKRPWKVYKQTLYLFNETPFAAFEIADAEDRGVFRMEGPKERCEANARLILDAVNGRDKLVEIVRRFVEMANHMPPMVGAWALLDAEMPGWRDGNLVEGGHEGHRRLGKLMTAAYEAIGEEEKE